MLDGIIDRVRAHLAIRSLRKHPVYKAAFDQMQWTIGDTRAGLGKHGSQEFKEKQVEHLLNEVTEVVSAQNPVIVNRHKLSEAVLVLAKYQVLVLPAPGDEEPDDTGLRGMPGITGLLKPHIARIAEGDEEIRELSWSLGNPAPQDLYGACLFRYWVAHFRMSVFNSMRIALGDCHQSKEKDWLRPFVAAMCAWEESNYRKLVGLPGVLHQDGVSEGIRALQYSAFLNIVLKGANNPFYEWTETFDKQDALDEP